MIEAVRVRHAGALENACWALRNLAAGDAAINAALLQAGAAAALVAAVNEAVRARHASALEQACRALANLARGDAADSEARRQALVAMALLLAAAAGTAARRSTHAWRRWALPRA